MGAWRRTRLGVRRLSPGLRKQVGPACRRERRVDGGRPAVTGRWELLSPRTDQIQQRPRQTRSEAIGALNVMDQPQGASRTLRPKNLNRNIQGGILSQGFAHRVVATDSLKEDEIPVLVLHGAKRRHRWHQSINVGRGDHLSGGQGSREFAKLLRPRLHFGACTGLVRNDMNGSEMAKGNRPKLTRDLGAIDIYATGDQIKPLLFVLRQVQDCFPRVREFRNLSAKARRRPKGHYQTGPGPAGADSGVAGAERTARSASLIPQPGQSSATILRRRPRGSQDASCRGRVQPRDWDGLLMGSKNATNGVTRR